MKDIRMKILKSIPIQNIFDLHLDDDWLKQVIKHVLAKKETVAKFKTLLSYQSIYFAYWVGITNSCSKEGVRFEYLGA